MQNKKSTSSFKCLEELKIKKYVEFHLRQADHNKDLSDSIFKQSISTEKSYFDWVATISFYTCLHYVTVPLFIEDSYTFYNIIFEKQPIEDVRKYRRSRDGDKGIFPRNAASGRHEIRKTIVTENFSVISKYYNKLFSDSMTARYTRYVDQEDFAQKSLFARDKIIDWFNENYRAKAELII